MRIRTARKFAFLRNIKAVLLAITVVAAGATVAHAAESTGTIDANFGNNGLKDFAPFTGEAIRPVKSVAVGNNNGVLTLVKNTDSNYANVGFGLIQTTSTGSLDVTFNATGYRKFPVTAPITAYDPTQLFVTSGGSIYVAGTYSSSSGSGLFVYKLNANGSFDSAWGTGGMSEFIPEFQAFNVAMTISASGAVYLMGYGNYDWIVKLNSTGGIDTTFGRTGANGAGYYMGIFMGSPYGSYVTRSLFGFAIDETTTPHSVNIFTAPSGSQIVIQHLKFGTSQTNMTGNSGNISLYQAEADTTWAATSLISGTSTATNGFLRVDVAGNNAVLKYNLASSNIMYVVTNTQSSNAYKVAAIDLSQKRLLSSFGTGGILDVSSLGFDGAGMSGIISAPLGGDTLWLYGYDSTYKGIVGKVANGAIDTTFGTSGTASFAACAPLSPSSLVRTSDGALTASAANGNVNPVVLRLGRMTSGGSTSSCGTTTTTTTTTMPSNNNNNPPPSNGPSQSLATPVGTIVDVPGVGIRVTVTNLVAGAHLGIAVVPTTFVPGPNLSEYPGMDEQAVGASTVTVSRIRWENMQGQFIRYGSIPAGSYRIYVQQLTGTVMNPIGMSMSMNQTVTVSQNIAVSSTPTTTVPSASVASGAGVTVTDPTVYSTSTPQKVSADSAITVMTPAQAKSNDIVTKTPDVCLPANDDIVFIDTGKCIAQIVNEKTGKVLRTLRTTVVEDEVTQLNVGNEVAVLAPIYFESGSTALNAAATARLKSIKAQVSAAGTVLLVGHSGIITGDTPENRALSKARAVAVANGLKAIKAKGPFYVTPVGAADPAVNKKTEAAQAKNRRVVIVLVP